VRVYRAVHPGVVSEFDNEFCYSSCDCICSSGFSTSVLIHKYIKQLSHDRQEDAYFYLQIDLAEKGTLKDLINDLFAEGQVMKMRTCAV
jgi:hypothetical protein